jgi:hypothetical protein
MVGNTPVCSALPHAVLGEAYEAVGHDLRFVGVGFHLIEQTAFPRHYVLLIANKPPP